MPARVMLSSVTKDDILLGDIGSLKDSWYQFATLQERLKQKSAPLKKDSRIDFTSVRAELTNHLEGKYGFEVYNFQNRPSDGGSPQGVTILETHRSQLVIGIFGSQSGWKVPDQDPLTPTFREWRAALEQPLKFKLFVLKGSLALRKPPELEGLMTAITDYKRGTIYSEFEDVADLFARVDRAMRDYLNKAVISYASDVVAKQPNSETERWLLLPYRTRVEEMSKALERIAASLRVNGNILTLSSVAQPIALHCVPDNFSIPESKKFAAYIFDDEVSASNAEGTGLLHIVAAFGGVTDLQIRRHLGNFEAAEVYSAPWGFYATVPSSGMQCVYLPRCVNSLTMQSRLSEAISWLVERAEEIGELAVRRGQILKVISKRSEPAKVRKAGGL
jgi:hypothetical protein